MIIETEKGIKFPLKYSFSSKLYNLIPWLCHSNIIPFSNSTAYFCNIIIDQENDLYKPYLQKFIISGSKYFLKFAVTIHTTPAPMIKYFTAFQVGITLP
jgi:hypothetical protein